MRRGPSLFIVLVLLFACAYGAQQVLTAGWNRLAAYAPAYLRSARPETGPAPLADHLVLIAVDGLEPSDVTLLPSLDWIRRQGASFRLTVPTPATAHSAAATLLTGAPPELHGYLSPALNRTTEVDSLIQAAARVEHSFAGVGSGTLSGLAGTDWQTPATTDELVAAAQALVSSTGPDLAIIEVQFPTTRQEPADETSDASAAEPPAETDTHQDALGRLDSMLVQILEPLDLKTSAVMVVGLPSDEGSNLLHADEVPLVMAGAGIRRDTWGTGSLTDAAPTAAALLGIPTPVISQGEPLLSALTAEGRPADVIVQQYLSSRRTFTTSALQTLGDTEELPALPESQAEAAAYTDLLSQRLKDAQMAFWKQTAPLHLPYLGVLLILLILYLVVALTRRFGGPLFFSMVTYFATFHVLLLTGGGYLGTVAKLPDVTRTTLMVQGLKVALAMGMACLVNGFLLSRQRIRRNMAGVAALHTALAAAAVVTVPLIVLLAITGWDFPAGLPGPGLVAWFLVGAFQVVVIGYLSPLWALLTVNTARLSLKLWPLQEKGDPVRKADNVVRLKAIRRHAQHRR